MKAYDVIVIGAGHAGIEASMAAANLGASVLTLTVNLDNVGFLACNPSIGGTGKAHLVCEIDALGGVMGKLADKTALQIRMLNTGKGAAVHSLRTQTDKIMYQVHAKQLLETTPNITLRQGEVVSLSSDTRAPGPEPNGSGRLNSIGVQATRVPDSSAGAPVPLWQIQLATGEIFKSPSVIVATGTYLDSQVLIGNKTFDSGPSGFARSVGLAKSLKQLGVEMRRFKTGTPPRLNARTINYLKTIPQPGHDNVQTFSFLTKGKIRNIVDCHLTYTNKKSHQVIQENIHLSPMYGDTVRGTGPRYCPSIEDKIVRFPDAVRHQIFLEPESLHSNEIYMQGMSTSLPTHVQAEFVATIEGLENAQILRDAYAIEYDCIDSTQLDATLEFKGLPGLFFAGQINGTSGYEEAAAQGLVAGINAGLMAPGSEPNGSERLNSDGVQAKRVPDSLAGANRFTLSRTNSYIGVLIDDLVTKGTNEPYRMMTSRAEHRLYLRQDNADIRLTPLGRDIGLVCDKRWKIFQRKLTQIKAIQAVCLQHNFIAKPNGEDVPSHLLAELEKFPITIVEHVFTEQRYSGYIAKELAQIQDAKRRENTPIPPNIDFFSIKSLSQEARSKLSKIRPTNIGQATRISGVSPADIAVLLVWLRKN